MAEPTRALVLSGGGADGAYEVGVIKALCSGASPATDYRPLDPEVFVGTSIGAFNATALVSLWSRYGAASVSQLERLWLERLASVGLGPNGFYRFRTDPTPVIDPRQAFDSPFRAFAQLAADGATLGWDAVQRMVHLVSTPQESIGQRVVELINVSSFVDRTPFEKTLEQSIAFDTVRASNKRLRIVATNWQTGELRTFTNADMTNRLGPMAILASSAVPGFFPPTEFGAQVFVDGGVLLNTPLKPAIECQAEELHVIYLDPDIKRIGLGRIQNTLETFYRMIQIGWAFAVNRDIHSAREINRGLAVFQRASRGDEIGHKGAGELISAARRVVERLRGGSPYRPLVIHRYHPREDIGGGLGFLNLDRTRLEGLIEQGFVDTVGHDCRVAGCVLLDGATGDVSAHSGTSSGDIGGTTDAA